WARPTAVRAIRTLAGDDVARRLRVFIPASTARERGDRIGPPQPAAAHGRRARAGIRRRHCVRPDPGQEPRAPARLGSGPRLVVLLLDAGLLARADAAVLVRLRVASLPGDGHVRSRHVSLLWILAADRRPPVAPRAAGLDAGAAQRRRHRTVPARRPPR